jgi:hypothetical protein
MAYTPQELAKRITDTDRAKIRELERKIDSALVQDFGRQAGGRVIVSTDYLDLRIRSEIEGMYSRAGWNIKYSSDQRDGDWFELTPKSQSSSRRYR